MSVVANVAINVDAANAIQQLNRVDGAVKKLDRRFVDANGRLREANGRFVAAGNAAKGAAVGVNGLGTALQSALGPLLSVATALATVKRGLDVAFERGAAEQRLRNLTSSTGEFNAAMALAAQTADKFGLTQGEASKALGDVYSRLKGVGFGLQETGQIYQGFNVIARQSGLAGEEAAGAFFQLSQALGKGKLNGDEFVIVAERMPQLLDAIAQTTGKSRGELTEMASQGQITSQVLYEALSGAADAAGDLNSKLTAQQRAMSNLSGVVDQLLNSIGQVFAPVVTAGAEALAVVGQKLADWWGYVGNVIFPKVYEALQPVITSLKAAFEDIDFDIIRVALQNILIKGFEVAIGVISNFSKGIAFIIDRFKELSQTPVFQFIAEQVGRLAGFLGLTNDKVQEFKDKQDEVTQAAAETISKYSSLPPGIEDAKEKAKQLKEEQKKITAEIQHQAQLTQGQIALESQRVTMGTNLVQARSQAEIAVNNVILQRLEYELQSTTNAQDRARLIKEIYNLEVANARATYQATVAQIAAQTQLVELAYKEQQIKLASLQTELALAEAKGKEVANFIRAIELQQQAIRLAAENVNFTRQIAAEQLRGADATYQAAVQAAALKAETTGAAQAATQFAGSMQQAATAAAAVAAVLPKEPRTLAGLDPAQGPGFGTAAGGLPFGQAMRAQFAQGRAEILGSGYGVGRNEMRAAIGRYTPATTDTANVNPQVNITTGPVMQMDGNNYVTQRDLMSATQSAARQGANMALGSLRSDPSTRRAVGLAR